MKAMLIKDWKLMKGQKQFVFILCIFLAVFGATSNNLGFLISYMTLMATIFSISTISYDEYNNGMVYLLALPISRRKYVEEKYLFCLLTSLIVSAVSLIVTLGIGIVRSTCNTRRSGAQCGSSPGNGCFDMWLYASNTTQIWTGEKSNRYGSNGSCNFCNRICHGVDW